MKYIVKKSSVDMQNIFATRRGAQEKMIEVWHVIDESGKIHWDMSSSDLAESMAAAMTVGDTAEIQRLTEISQYGRVLTSAERSALDHSEDRA